MRLRRWLSVLAIVGVLLHAGALVRHHVYMAGGAAAANSSASAAVDALLADLTFICHAGGDTPDGGTPPSAKPSCPVCSGLASLIALAPPDNELLHRFEGQGIKVAAGHERLSTPVRLRPHSRGPPLA